MKQKIGPDGTYPQGGPLNEFDEGGLNVAFSIVEDKRMAVMHFGTTVKWLAVPPEVALEQALFMRERIHEKFGEMSYDATTLPLRVEIDKVKRIITTTMPQAAAILAANPEMFLAWAEYLEVAADSLGVTKNGNGQVH